MRNGAEHFRIGAAHSRRSPLTRRHWRCRLCELTAAHDDLDWLIVTGEDFLPAVRNYAEAARAFRDEVAAGTTATELAFPLPPAPPAGPAGVLPGAQTRLVKRIGEWKRAAGFADPIGQDLGIVGPEGLAHTDPPVLKLRAQGNGWAALTFSVWEPAGIWLQSRRQGAEAWEFLAIDTARPFRDERPNLPGAPAEWREYRACWWDQDTPSNAFGPALRVTVSA